MFANQRKNQERKKRNSLVLLGLLIFISPALFAQVEKVQVTKLKKNEEKPGYSASKSMVEEPLQVQKDLYIPQRSYNIVNIQKKALKEAGASETAIQNATDAPSAGQFD